MRFFYNLTGNYAITLLLFTIVVHIILMPLSIKQQKNQVRMSQIRPKEQVIRKKYAGRKDTATNQKMMMEIQAMYKAENYSQFGGCLPMLLQLPVIFILFNIVRRPLTYIAGFSSELIERISYFLGDAIAANAPAPEIQIVRAFEGTLDGFYGNLETIQNYIRNIDGIVSYIGEYQLALFNAYENMNFNFFGQSLLIPPSEALFSSLMIIMVLNVVLSFFQMKVTRKIQQKSMAVDMMNANGMKIMEYTMPLMILFFTYKMESALGLYWIYRSVVTIGQTFVLAKIYPIKETTEEDLRLAEEKYGSGQKKKKKKKKTVTDELENDDNSDDETDADTVDSNNKSDKHAKLQLEEVKKQDTNKTAPKKFTVKRRSSGDNRNNKK